MRRKLSSLICFKIRGNGLVVTFREANIRDLQSLVDMLANDTLGRHREDTSSPLNSAYQKAYEEIEKDPNNMLLVAESEDIVCGMLQLTFIPYLTFIGSWRALIEGVRVSSDFRGQGIGEKLFKHAIAIASERGCSMVQLTSDKQRPAALSFYEKLGFTATHEGFKLPLRK